MSTGMIHGPLRATPHDRGAEVQALPAAVGVIPADTPAGVRTGCGTHLSRSKSTPKPAMWPVKGCTFNVFSRLSARRFPRSSEIFGHSTANQVASIRLSDRQTRHKTASRDAIRGPAAQAICGFRSSEAAQAFRPDTLASGRSVMEDWLTDRSRHRGRSFLRCRLR